MSDRFGFDAPGHQPLEDSIRWAAANGFCYIDFQADHPPNDIASFDAARVRRVRDLCTAHGIAIGIHPSSAINNAGEHDNAYGVVVPGVLKGVNHLIDGARTKGVEHLWPIDTDRGNPVLLCINDIDVFLLHRRSP